MPRLQWVCQIDAPTIVENHPKVGGPASVFTFCDMPAQSAYGLSPRNVFDEGFEFSDVDARFSDIIRNPIASVSELSFSISALEQFYATLCEVNETDETFFIGWRVRLWASDGIVAGLAYSGSNWTDLNGTPITFTPSITYPKIDTYFKVFDGVISDIKSGLSSTRFTAEADDILRGKTIGDLVVGRENKIAPVVFGDMTDEDAFIPAVFPENITEDAGVICTSGADIDSIWLYSQSADKKWGLSGTLIQSGGVLTGIDSGESGNLSGNIGTTGGGDASMDSLRNARVLGGDPFYAVFPSTGEVISECAIKDYSKSLAYDLSGSAPFPLAQGYLNPAFNAKSVEVSRGVFGTPNSTLNAGAGWVGQDPPRSAFFTLIGDIRPKSIAVYADYEALGAPMYLARWGCSCNELQPDPISGQITYRAFVPATETEAEQKHPTGCGISGDWRTWLNAQSIGVIHPDPLVFSPIPHSEWLTLDNASVSMMSSRLAIKWDDIGFDGIVSQFSVMCGSKCFRAPYSSLSGLGTGDAVLQPASYAPATGFYELQFGAYTTEPTTQSVTFWEQSKVAGIWVDFDNDYRLISQSIIGLTHSQRIDLIRNQSTANRTVTFAPQNKKLSDVSKTSFVVRGVGQKVPYPDVYNDQAWSGKTFTLQDQFELHYLKILFKARVEAKEGQIFSKAVANAGGANMSECLSILDLPAINQPSGDFANGFLDGSPRSARDVLERLVLERTGYACIAEKGRVRFIQSDLITGPTRIFSADNCILSGDNLPEIEWGMTPRRELVTKVIVRYRLDSARGKYSRSIVLSPSGAEASHAVVSGSDAADAVAGLLITQNKIGVGRTEQIDCDFIRDDLSAVRLAVWLANQLSQPRYFVELGTHLNEINGLDLGSVVKIDLPTQPQRIRASSFLITGINISSSAVVKLNLMEIL